MGGGEVSAVRPLRCLKNLEKRDYRFLTARTEETVINKDKSKAKP